MAPRSPVGHSWSISRSVTARSPFIPLFYWHSGHKTIYNLVRWQRCPYLRFGSMENACDTRIQLLATGWKIRWEAFMKTLSLYNEKSLDACILIYLRKIKCCLFNLAYMREINSTEETMLDKSLSWTKKILWNTNSQINNKLANAINQNHCLYSVSLQAYITIYQGNELPAPMTMLEVSHSFIPCTPMFSFLPVPVVDSFLLFPRHCRNWVDKIMQM